MVSRTWFRKFLWLGLLLAGTAACGATPPCTTTRGLMVVGFTSPNINRPIPERWQNCAAIQRIEDSIVASLPKFDPKNLAGYQVWLEDPETKLDPWGREVVGYTQCVSRKMVIWDRGIDIKYTSLGHEIAHGLQKCAAKLPLDPEWKDEWWASDHADWYREGIYTAIEKAKE
jgi:hypothetical protein